jgi:hypothetical protein
MWHASPADLAAVRDCLEPMAAAVASGDPAAFVHRLHAGLITALEHRDGAETSRLIALHNTQD